LHLAILATFFTGLVNARLHLETGQGARLTASTYDFHASGVSMSPIPFKPSLLLLAAVSLALGGCARTLIGERIGAEEIVVAEPAQVTQCKSLGKTTFSVLASVGPITRSAEAVEDNLTLMARNEAVSKGGDTIVRGSSMEYGKRTFEIFRCKP